MKIGIVGLGHLGKIHLKLLSEMPEIQISGLFDIDINLLKSISQQYQYHACHSYQNLLENCDAIYIVTPTLSHFSLAKQAILCNKHVFLEKPSTFLVEETFELYELATKHHVLVQVGHIERFNPAFTTAKKHLSNITSIKSERSAHYNIRGTDVSVVMDLMIHDIDLVLSLVDSDIKKISANGKNTVTTLIDEAFAIIEFENGVTATFLVNRAADKNVRTVHVDTKTNIVTIDLLKKELSVYHTNSKNTENQPIEQTNALKDEIESFFESIKTNKPAQVSLKDAEKALMVVKEIEKQIGV